MGFARPEALAALPVLGLGACALAWRRRPSLLLAGVVLVAFGAGWANAAVRTEGTAALAALAERVPACSVTVRVLEDAGWLGQLAGVLRADCDGWQTYADGGVVALDGSSAPAGATLSGRALLVPLDGADPKDTARKRLGALAVLHEAQLREVAGPGGVWAAAAMVRNGLRRATRGLDVRRAGLLLGLTIGDTRLLDQATIERFRRTGLSHVVAVSGSNLAIVLGALALLARSLPHKARVTIAAAGIGFFVVVVGPDASVLRAAAMGAISLAALAYGRRAEPVQALGLAAIVLLAWRPGLVYSVGLMLSAAATLGIVLWSAPLAEALRWLPRPLALGLAVTLAAQAAVAPLLLGVFGQLPLASPLANALALPAVPPATILGFVSGIAALLWPPLGVAVGGAAGLFSGWILTVADKLGDEGWASLQLPRWWAVIAAAPVVFAAGRSLAAARQARDD